ncbi:MAG: PA14 domain-containing protein [Candidatus Poribacteria bacterium]|nr:PA14 domain-containing protein [Candidatus Poribacteria bacterium]
MKKEKNKISLLISLGIHFVLLLTISPFLVTHFNETDDKITLTFFKANTPEQVERRVMRQHKAVQPKRSNDSGSSALSREAPKYDPEMNPPKAPVFDDVAPEIVTFADIPQTDASSLPNASFGKDAEASGPIVVPEYRGAGGKGNARRPGRGISGTGRGSGMGKGLSGVTGLDGLGSIVPDEVDEDIMGLGIFDSDVKPGHGLIGQVYIPGGPIHKMPDFTRMTPLYTFAAANLDVPERSYTEGFPTPQKQTVVEDFAVRFRGKLAIDTPGTYMFELLSDDGSKLYINGKLVVDNDGLHAPESKQSYVALTDGFHLVEIHYFQGPRVLIALQWFYKPPNRPRQIVPPEVIFHPGKPDDPDALKNLKQQLKK